MFDLDYRKTTNVLSQIISLSLILKSFKNKFEPIFGMKNDVQRPVSSRSFILRFEEKM